MRRNLGYATYLTIAFAAAILFALLGKAVVANGEPAGLLAWERTLVGHSALIAWWLTWTCYTMVLGPICIILLILAWRFPAWRARILFSIVMLLLCWRGADFFQHFFARPRRLDWVVKHETSFSYPSSHAAIATGFYAFWALVLYVSELAATTRKVAAALLVLLALAICWARLALGAHYLTDLAGGALLAIALVAAGLAVFPSVILSLSKDAGRAHTSAE